MSQEGQVFIGRYEHTFIFKVEGRLTQKSLRNANTAVERCMDDPDATALLIDITHCPYMDSTILGILARWAITFSRRRHIQPFLIGLEGNPLESIFKRMRLNSLFHISSNPVTLDHQALSQLAFAERYSAQEYAKHLLTAHEALAELSPENAKEFATVIQCLQAEMQSE